MIHGWTAPGWGGVREAFLANFDKRHEVGAAATAYHKGRLVADLWGGVADDSTGAAWEEDTMVLVYSSTKGAVAMCANRLAQEGVLDMEAPVVTYWPEFAQGPHLAESGKDRITVSDLLSHRAGLAWTDGIMTTEEALAWDPVIAALESQSPSWPPRSAHGYHATTFGWLVGEVIRRVTGDTVGAYLRDEIAGPLGADFFIGLPEEHEERVSKLVAILDSLAAGRVLGEGGGGTGHTSELAELAGVYFAPGGPLYKALATPGGALASDPLWNSRELHAAEIPAANGICDARSLALLYAACIGEQKGMRLLDAEQLRKATLPQTEGPDRVLMGLDIQFGLGFMLNRGLLASAGIGGPHAFGHFGLGGSAGWADPDAELAFGYVMNRLDIGTTGDARSFSLMKACYDAIG